MFHDESYVHWLRLHHPDSLPENDGTCMEDYSFCSFGSKQEEHPANVDMTPWDAALVPPPSSAPLLIMLFSHP